MVNFRLSLAVYWTCVIGLALICLVQHASASEWAYISGNVINRDGTPICAMIVANGKYVFSNPGNGQYSLRVPLDGNNEVTLLAFADGFALFKQNLDLNEALYQEIVMDTANLDEPRMYLVGNLAVTKTNDNWVKIYGSVRSRLGTSICAIILANGQYTFSDQLDGKYSLDVPLDNNSEITIFAFADGFRTYKQIIKCHTEDLCIADLAGTYALSDSVATTLNGNVLTPQNVNSYSGTLIIRSNGDERYTSCANNHCTYAYGKILDVRSGEMQVFSGGCTYTLRMKLSGNVLTITCPDGVCDCNSTEVGVWVKTDDSPQ